MVGLQGFWLNLDRYEERAFWMRNRLGALCLSDKYQRIAGVEGDHAEAVSRGLKPGEWGAWQGWIRMLDHASQSSAAVVHLMEDDVDISDSFLRLVDDDLLRGLLARQAIVCTDAYVSPRQCLALLQALKEAERVERQWLDVVEGFRVPCINSMLLTPVVAGRLCGQLREIIGQDCQLSPVDIAMSKVSIDFCTIVPFVTSPMLDLAANGSTREHDDSSLSRDALTLLRRSLFCVDHDHEFRLGFADLMVKLVGVGAVTPY